MKHALPEVHDSTLAHECASVASGGELVAQPFATSVDRLTITSEGAIVTLGNAPYPEEDPFWKRITPTTYFGLGAGAVALIFLLHELTTATKLGFPVDAAWVHLVYARNFFHHIAFEFNAGDRVTGPASPFWTVAVAFASTLFHDSILAAKLLGAIFLFLTAYYSYRTLRSLDVDHPTSLLCGFIVLTCSPLAWSELAGTESLLASAITIAALWSHSLQTYHGSDQHGTRRYSTGALFAIGVLARPEIALVFAITLVHWFITHQRERGRGITSVAIEEFWQDVRAALIGFFVLLVPIIITNQALAGTYVPLWLRSALGEASLPMIIARGDIAMLGSRLLVSWVAVGRLAAQLWFDHPLFLVTIPWAAIVLIRRSHGSHLEEFFGLGALILFFFPYFHALFLGLNELSATTSRELLFLLPIYLLTGFASLVLLAERYVMRGIGERSAILVTSLAIVVMGVAAIAIHETDWIIWSAMLVTLVALAVAIGWRHASSLEQGMKRYASDPHAFERLTLTSAEAESRSPLQVRLVLHALMLSALAWPLAELVPTAERYAAEVLANRSTVKLATLAATITPAGSAIATDAPGAFGYKSERTVLDVKRRIPGLPPFTNANKQVDLVRALGAMRPQSIALVDSTYHTFTERALATGYFTRINDGGGKPVNAPIYAIDYERTDTMFALLDAQAGLRSR